MSLPVWGPARDASLPNLVPRRQLANANSDRLVSTYGTSPSADVFTVLVGLKTLLSHAILFLEGHDQAVPLFLDAATFVFSAAMIARVPIPVAGDAHGAVGLHGSGETSATGSGSLREDSMASAMTAGIVVAFSAVGSARPRADLRRGDVGSGRRWLGVHRHVLRVGIGLGMASAN